MVYRGAVAKSNKYAISLLEHVADELNIKEVRFKTQGGLLTYKYDTVKQEGVGFDRPELTSLIFTGEVLKDMESVRHWVKEGLSQRAIAKIKVRQPLASMTIALNPNHRKK